MTHDVIYQFTVFADAKSAIQCIDKRFPGDEVSGLNYVADDTVHMVAACTHDAAIAEELGLLLGEHHGTRSDMTLTDLLTMPASVQLLGSADLVIDLLS